MERCTLYSKRLRNLHNTLRPLGRRPGRWSWARSAEALAVYNECRRNTERYHNICLCHPFEEDGAWDALEFSDADLARVRGGLYRVRPEGDVLAGGG